MSVQAQWNIDQTSRSVIGVARGILQAATTDNVQVLAILACERFGATLAISQETCKRIERDVVPTPKPAILDFLKSAVGYVAHDCVSQLSMSLAGIQFLGLATALVTTMDHFKAAVAVQAMLVATATDKTLVPTVRQVQDLLASIESRCLRSGFGNEVAGWQLLLGRSHHDCIDRSRKRPSRYPECQGVENLVDAFRQLRRVGNADVTAVTIITAADCAAWTVAFVKWCLGVAPTVTFEDGTPFIQQEDSEVVVRILKTPDTRAGAFEITIHSSVNDPSELVGSRSDGLVTGMISASAYMELLLQYRTLDTTLAERALHQAIPYALHEVLNKIVFLDQLEPDYSLVKTPRRHLPEQEMSKSSTEGEKLFLDLRLSPLPQSAILSKVYGMLFNLKGSYDLRALDEGLIITDLPLVALFLKSIKSSCACSKCCSNPAEVKMGACEEEILLHDISIVIATILGLSLFKSPDALLIWSEFSGHTHNRFNNTLINSIYLTVTKGVYTRCPVSSLYKWALELVGHNPSEDLERRPCILSSYKGQAVWPTIYQTNMYAKHGYLSLSWLPGQLLHRDEIYKLVYGPMNNSFREGADPITNQYPDPISYPHNLCPPNLRLRWMVTPREGAILEACLTLDGDSRFSFFECSACSFHLKLARAIIVENCNHDSTAELTTPDRFAEFTGPFDPTNIDSSAEDKVCVVAVDGSDELRFFALSAISGGRLGEKRVVLRKTACLGCCLDVSRRTDYKVLIL